MLIAAELLYYINAQVSHHCDEGENTLYDLVRVDEWLVSVAHYHTNEVVEEIVSS